MTLLLHSAISSPATKLSIDLRPGPYQPSCAEIPRIPVGLPSLHQHLQQRNKGVSELGSQHRPACRRAIQCSAGRDGMDAGPGKDAEEETSAWVSAAVKAAGLVAGKGLPPGLLIKTAEALWRGGWKVMMSQLAPSSKEGSYQRPQSAFRSRVGDAGFPVEAGRYHLYAALSCPWAHRALIVHALKGLGDAVPLSIAAPGDSGLWVFNAKTASLGGRLDILRPTKDQAGGKQTIKEVYQSQPGGYDGRCTVPLLWDSKQRRPVNNESADIIEILDASFDDYAKNPTLDLNPPSKRAEIARWNDLIYDTVNNGVYKCGFATSQGAYERAVEALFVTLNEIEDHLSRSRYLCGDSITLADVRLFTTLLRFDPVYYILFKCSRKKIAEFRALSGYLRDIYQLPGVAATCDLVAITQQYYGTLFPINPSGIIPVVAWEADEQGLLKPHKRESLGKVLA